MRILLFGKRVLANDVDHLKLILSVSREIGMEIFFDANLYSQLDKIDSSLASNYTTVSGVKEIKEKKIELLLSLGGDGTILRAVTAVMDSQIPILGINLGRLGFLASTEKSRTKEALLAVKNRELKIEQRSLLTVNADFDIFIGENIALNDFTVIKRDNSAMITIHTYIDDEYLNAIWADGLIISTPTGSTGYSLSCGGPIVFPGSGNFVITPIAPHNLTVRPIIISDDKKIKLRIEGRTDSFLCTLDSRHEIVPMSHEILVSKCNYSVNLASLSNTTFISTVSEKLNWGLDNRN